MLDAVVGAVIIVVATSSMLYSIEVAHRVFDQAGKYPLTECPMVGRSQACNGGEKDLLERLKRIRLVEKGLSATDITESELDKFQDDFKAFNIDKAPDRMFKNEL